MKKFLIYKQQLAEAVILVFFFLFFLGISRWAPVVGDDWGYAVGGRYNNPIRMAWGNYFSWSGRFFSELWGFSVAPHKQLWNILNALLFTGILGMLVHLSKGKKLPMILFGIVLMLTVPNGLRMQTYTWIMGTTYVVPLAFFLLYLKLLYDMIFADKNSKCAYFVMLALNLVIPLYMENAAAMLAGGNALVILYVFFKDRAKLKKVIGLFAVSVIGTCLIKFSPGAVYRMERDHAEFQKLSLFAKISLNWGSFIRFTFTNNQWCITLLSVVMLANAWLCRKRGKLSILVAMSFFYVFALVQSWSWELFDLTGINIFYILFELTVPHSLTLNTIGYIGFTAALFFGAYRFSDNEEMRMFRIFVLFLAGGANLVMLISPIFDVRSALYTIYMFILFSMSMAGQLSIPKKIGMLCCGGLAVWGFLCVYDYISLYRMIHLVDLKRQSQIAYYQERPDAGDAYILAFEDQTVHSGNIEDTDTYHLDTFKYYYYLNEDLTLHFYYLENYTEEEIIGG